MLWLFLSVAWPQNPRSIEAVVGRLAAELAPRFPPLTGEVIRVDGKRVYVNLGKRDNMVTGMRLALFRQGEALQRSTTGKVLSRAEADLGTVEVVQVFEAYAVTQRVESAATAPVRAGDRVRLTAGRIVLGLLPLAESPSVAVASDVLAGVVQDALEASGRFRVISPDRVRIWLLEHGLPRDRVISPEQLPALARALHASYMLRTLVKDLQGTGVLELQILSPMQQLPVAVASGLLPPQTPLARRTPTPPAPQVSQAPPTPPAPGPPPPTPVPRTEPKQRYGGLFKTPPLPPDIAQWNLANHLTEIHRVSDLLLEMDAGDLDGDGKTEVVLRTDSRIWLYRLQGKQLTLVDSFTPRQQGKLLSAQLLRLGRSKSLGIVVNRQLSPTEIDSFILTLQGQRLVVWQDHLFDILLAVDDDGDGVKESVWGQPFDAELFFQKGVVRRYSPLNGALKLQGRLTVPYAFRATGATLARLSAGGPRDLVFIDENHRLRLYRGKTTLWKSRVGVGGSNSYGEVELQRGRDVLKPLFFFEPVPVVADLNHDGIDEVLLIRNAASLGGVLPNRTQYSEGDVVLLRQEPYGYTLSPISPQFNGMISGLAVVGGATRGVLIAVSQRKDILGRKGETILFLSRLP